MALMPIFLALVRRTDRSSSKRKARKCEACCKHKRGFKDAWLPKTITIYLNTNSKHQLILTKESNVQKMRLPRLENILVKALLGSSTSQVNSPSPRESPTPSNLGTANLPGTNLRILSISSQFFLRKSVDNLSLVLLF